MSLICVVWYFTGNKIHTSGYFHYDIWFFSYSKTIISLGIKLEEYWKEIRHMKNQEGPNGIPVEDAVLVHYGASLNVLHAVFRTWPYILPEFCFPNLISHLHNSLYLSLRVFRNRPDQNWVQCDECLKWRKLPDGIDCGKLPDKWFCLMNPDPQFRYCKVWIYCTKYSFCHLINLPLSHSYQLCAS